LQGGGAPDLTEEPQLRGKRAIMKILMEGTMPLMTPHSPDPIRYAECPHCHTEVMVRADGHCIACGKNSLDKKGVDPHRTMVSIDNVHKLPHCCFVCGEETQRRQRLAWTSRISTRNLPFWFAPLAWLFSYLPGSQFSTRSLVILPVCAKCAPKARKLRPLSMRAGLDCRLLVHRTFRKQFEDLNGRECLEWERDLLTSNAPPPKFVPPGPSLKF